MTDYYNRYEMYLKKNNYFDHDKKDCSKKCPCPSVVILTFSIVDATVAEVNVVGSISCSVPTVGSPVAPFIQCLISQGFELIAFTQGGIDNNFITYTFVDCN